MDNYHIKAQKFIKSAHAQGRKVTAEGSELIAGKQGTYKEPVKPKRSMFQHDAYLQAMQKMHKKGGYSNGIGVGP